MKPQTKYWLEENKDKFYIGGAVLALSALVIGGYWYFNNEQNYDVGESVSITMADYLLTQRDDGHLETISVSENEAVATLNLNDGDVVFRGEELDTLYVYDASYVHQVTVSDDGEMGLVDGIAMPDMSDVAYASTNGSHFGFLTDDDLVITDSEGEVLLVFEDRATEVYQLSDEGVYLSHDNEIHFVNYNEGDTQYIDMGDETTRFSKHGDTIVARNNFGQGNDIETVLNMTDGSLLIDEVKRMPYDNKIDVLIPQEDTQLVYVETRTNNEGVITRQDLATIAVKADMDADETVDLSDFTLPMETTEAFSPDKTLASRGFLYDWTESGIRIIEMRNGREITRLSTQSEESQLYVPIFNK